MRPVDDRDRTPHGTFGPPPDLHRGPARPAPTTQGTRPHVPGPALRTGDTGGTPRPPTGGRPARRVEPARGAVPVPPGRPRAGGRPPSPALDGPPTDIHDEPIRPGAGDPAAGAPTPLKRRPSPDGGCLPVPARSPRASAETVRPHRAPAAPRPTSPPRPRAGASADRAWRATSPTPRSTGGLPPGQPAGPISRDAGPRPRPRSTAPHARRRRAHAGSPCGRTARPAPQRDPPHQGHPAQPALVRPRHGRRPGGHGHPRHRPAHDPPQARGRARARRVPARRRRAGDHRVHRPQGRARAEPAVQPRAAGRDGRARPRRAWRGSPRSCAPTRSPAPAGSTRAAASSA